MDGTIFWVNVQSSVSCLPIYVVPGTPGRDTEWTGFRVENRFFHLLPPVLHLRTLIIGLEVSRYPIYGPLSLLSLATFFRTETKFTYSVERGLSRNLLIEWLWIFRYTSECGVRTLHGLSSFDTLNFIQFFSIISLVFSPKNTYVFDHLKTVRNTFIFSIFINFTQVSVIIL